MLMVYFVKRVTVRAWALAIWPRLFVRRVRGRPSQESCYVFEGSRGAFALARLSAWLLGVPVSRARMPLSEIRDAHGHVPWWNVFYQALGEVQTDMVRDPVFQEAMRLRTAGRLPLYLAKALIRIDLSDRDALWRLLLWVQACAWWVKYRESSGAIAELFIEARPWFQLIARHVAKLQITAVEVPAPFRPWAWARRLLSPERKAWLRHVQAQWTLRKVVVRLVQCLRALWRPAHEAPGPGGPRIAVDYFGHLNLTAPERHSDLFFWQQSSLRGSDVMLCFQLSSDPLDERKWAQLREQGIGAVALTPQATTLASPARLHGPRFRPTRHAPARRLPRPSTPETAWLRERVTHYEMVRRFWADLCAARGVAIYVTWFKYDESHCAIADAVEQTGGITAMYQRSYQFYPSVYTTTAADIFFGFSRQEAETERQSGSVIPYYVITGYLGDHRFPLLREEARRVRETLQRHGARHILAFADENTRVDTDWYEGHEVMQRHYAFFLEKVLNEPWFGLVIKPKVPSTLRQRLGPVAELLRRGEATGRCYLYTDGVLHGSSPPAVAAMAADVMVHGDLHAATAGIESALAGVPTLLFARHGWPLGSLYDGLDPGHVIFSDWESLWTSCVEHWRDPHEVPGFGDWRSQLDRFDPFRDGRAAERMGTYLQWVLEGLRAGLSRETVMADAAARYIERWGKEHIVRIDGDTSQATARRQPLAEATGAAVEVASRGATFL